MGNGYSFICGRPVRGDEFLGRESELRIVLNRLRNGESTAIIGHPNIGKTSLLLKLAEAETYKDYFEEKEVFVNYIDLHPFGDNHTPFDFWKKSLNLLSSNKSKELHKLYLKTVRSKFDKDSLETLFLYMGQNGQQLILLLDEFETLIRCENFKSEFFGLLRSLASTTGGLSLVTATRLTIDQMNANGRQILDLGSPFFNISRPFRLRPFDDPTIEILLGRVGNQLSKDEQLFIRKIAGRNPFLIQSLAQSIIHYRGSDNIERALEDYLEQASQHYDDLWENLDEKTRTVAVILALMDLNGYALGKSYAFGEIENVAAYGPELKRLQEYGLAEQINNTNLLLDTKHALIWRGGQWETTGTGFSWWVRDVVIAQNRFLPSIDDWLKNKQYTLFITNEMWKTITDLPDWVTKGIAGFARSVMSEIVKKGN